MAATYEPIATTTLGSSASSITFDSIPGTYTDLRIILSSTADNGQNITLRFNDSSGTVYSGTFIVGQGSPSTGSQRNYDSTYLYIGNESTASTNTNPRLDMIDIFSYAGSTFKTVLMATSKENNNASASANSVEIGAGMWESTNAITKIVFLWSGTNNFKSGTTVTLYGILKA